MSVALAILFVLMILAPCVLAMRNRLRGGTEDGEPRLREDQAMEAAGAGQVADSMPEGLPLTTGGPDADVEAETPAVVAPAVSATTLKVAAAVVAAAKARAVAAALAKPREEVVPRVAAAPAAVYAAPATAASVSAPARRAELALRAEYLTADEMTLEELLDRAEYEAHVAEAAALRANAAASDAAARAATMRAEAAIDAAVYARAVATEAAEAARAVRASLNEVQPGEDDGPDLQAAREHRRAA